MKIFLICPVRYAVDVQMGNISKYVEKLESEGHTVHYPARDTDQIDPIGYRICTDNKNAITEADEVHIYWSNSSQGSLFDLGIAFALAKKLVIVNLDDVEITDGKSFANMIRHWHCNSEEN